MVNLSVLVFINFTVDNLAFSFRFTVVAESFDEIVVFICVFKLVFRIDFTRGELGFKLALLLLKLALVPFSESLLLDFF